MTLGCIKVHKGENNHHSDQNQTGSKTCFLCSNKSQKLLVVGLLLNPNTHCLHGHPCCLHIRPCGLQPTFQNKSITSHFKVSKRLAVFCCRLVYSSAELVFDFHSNTWVCTSKVTEEAEEGNQRDSLETFSQGKPWYRRTDEFSQHTNLPHKVTDCFILVYRSRLDGGLTLPADDHSDLNTYSIIISNTY